MEAYKSTCSHYEEFLREDGLRIYKEIEHNMIGTELDVACTVCHYKGPYLYFCARCITVRCVNNDECHMQDHSLQTKHYLGIHSMYAYIYCFECKLNIFDEETWPIVRSHFKRGGYIDETRCKLITYRSQLEEIRKKTPLYVGIGSDVGVKRLRNLGNTCFVNCMVQTLMHCAMVKVFFLADNHLKCFFHNDKTRCIVCQFFHIYQMFYRDISDEPVCLDGLLYIIWQNAQHFAGYIQQDAHECFLVTLHIVHNYFRGENITLRENTQCNGVNSNSNGNANANANGNGNDEQGENDEQVGNGNANDEQVVETVPVVDIVTNNCSCIIHQAFFGKMQSDVICQSCGTISSTDEPFMDISLNITIPDHQHKKGKIRSDSSVTLIDCIHQFVKQEDLGNSCKIECAVCRRKQASTKQMTIKQLPVVLVLHLKRFGRTVTNLNLKKTTVVKFPETLDMSAFTTEYRNAKSAVPGVVLNGDDEGIRSQNLDLKVGNDSCATYYLFSVINHFGTLNAGHYMAYVRVHTDYWYKCNDDVVTPASLTEVLNSEGYLLFYHKKRYDYAQ